jgi:hypothetical protein
VSVDLHLGQAPGAAALTTWASTPHAPAHQRDHELELDPLAGEDEAWAEEDLLWTPDEENYVRFVRSLWIAIVCCLLFWVLLAAAGFGVFGLITA